MLSSKGVERLEETPKKSKKPAPSAAKKSPAKSPKGRKAAAKHFSASIETDDFQGEMLDLGVEDAEAHLAAALSPLPLQPSTATRQAFLVPAQPPPTPATPQAAAVVSESSILSERLYERIAAKEAALEREIIELKHQQALQQAQSSAASGLSLLDRKVQQLEKALFESRVSCSFTVIVPITFCRPLFPMSRAKRLKTFKGCNRSSCSKGRMKQGGDLKQQKPSIGVLQQK